MKVSSLVFRYLPTRISLAIHSLPKEIFDDINEIRLRKDSPVSITAHGKNLFFREDGRICGINQGIYSASADLQECLLKLTNGSLYTCEEYMAMGFIPLPEGGRAGVCGRAMYRDGRVCGFAEITAINIRIHRNIPLFALPLAEEYKKNGLRSALVCAPPALGKTTFLRSAAYLLSRGKIMPPKRVAIADERCEIAPGVENCGILDVLSGAPKAFAISLLTRSMAPEVIICDEISPEESQAVAEAQNTGVCVIASAHGNSPKDILKRGRMRALLEERLFPLTVVIGRGYECKIFETEEFL